MANKKVSQLTSKPSVLTTDLFPIADPSTGQLFKTTISDLGTAIGSGVSSVNGLVGAVVLDTDDIQELVSPTNKWFTDTRARAALSASSPLAYNSGTGVFSLPQANGSTNGFLSSADWTTFNNKLSTATAASTYVPYTGATANVDLGLNYSLTAASIIKSGGTSTQFLKADGSIDTNTYLTTSSAASTYLPLTGGTLTGDLTLSSTNPRLYFTDTDNNPDYFISNTDGTFTVYDVTNSTSRLTITNLNTTLNTNLRIEGDVLIKQDSVFGGVAGYTAIGSDSAGIYLKSGTATSHAYLVLSGLTSYRNFTLPDATGTIALTSDLSSYLSLSGGTLTGALSGTSATFSGAINLTGTANSFQVASIFRNANRVFFGGDTGGYYFQNSGNTATVLQIADSGAATFSSSVSGISHRVYNGATTIGYLIRAADWGDSGNNLGIAAETTLGINFYTNGSATPKVIINSSGNVGIGTTSPGTKLHIISSLGTDAFAIGETGSNQRFRIGQESSYTGNYINSTNIDLKLMTYADGGSGGTMMFYTSTNTTLNERMRITSGGNVLIGDTADYLATKLYIKSAGATSSTNILACLNSSGTDYFRVRSDGYTYAKGVYDNTTSSGANVFVGSGGDFLRSTSSIKYKKNVLDYSKGLAEIMQMRAVTYEGKSKADEGKIFAGLIAEEVHDLGLTEFVQYAEDGTPDALAYQNMVSLLIKGMQELKAELDTLKNK